MNVVVVDTTIAGNLIGGAQTFLPSLMHGLTARNAEVHLIANGRPDPKIASYIESSGCLLHDDLIASDRLIEDQTPMLAAWINKISPDIYLISVSPDVGWTVLPQLNPQIATLTIGHTDDPTFYEPLKHYSAFVTRAIGVSEEICANFNQECGVERERISRIPYGVRALDDFSGAARLTSEPVRLIYVGRLEEEQKRVSDLIKIAKTLSARGIEYSFKIVGDGGTMPKFKDELADQISARQVHLLGWLNNKELLSHLRQSEIFLLASAYEGFCISLIEAMANGCCPIATDIKSGNKQLITDGENGFLVSVGDTDDFVEKIETLSLHQTKLLNMRRKAWETGKEYSIDKMAESYYDCFLQSIGDAKTVPRQPDDNFPLMKSCRSKYPLWIRRIKAKIKQYLSIE